MVREPSWDKSTNVSWLVEVNIHLQRESVDERLGEPKCLGMVGPDITSSNIFAATQYNRMCLVLGILFALFVLGESYVQVCECSDT